MSEKSKISFWHPASLICTCFGVGKIPFAPGTWGSLFGLFYPVALVSSVSFFATLEEQEVFLRFASLGVNIVLFSLVPIYIFFSVPIINVYQRKTGTQDASEIVVDEVVGQWIASILSVVFFIIFSGSPDAMPADVNNITSALPYFFIPFITFRIFDIVKRGPVGWIDRNVKGGLGVMLDDVVAGVLAGITSALIFMVI